MLSMNILNSAFFTAVGPETSQRVYDRGPERRGHQKNRSQTIGSKSPHLIVFWLILEVSVAFLSYIYSCWWVNLSYADEGFWNVQRKNLQILRERIRSECSPVRWHYHNVSFLCTIYTWLLQITVHCNVNSFIYLQFFFKSLLWNIFWIIVGFADCI